MRRVFFPYLIVGLLCCSGASAAWHSVLQVVVAALGYQGPLDIVGGAAFCYGYIACSQAIATTGTQQLVGWDRLSDSHDCSVVTAASGQLTTTVSGCITGGENGTLTATWIGAGAQAGYNQSSNGVYGFYDQASTNNAGSTASPVVHANSPSSGLYAYTFNGSNSELNTSTSGLLGAGSFSIFAAIKPTTLASGGTYSVTGAGSSGDPELRLVGQAGNATAKLDLVKQGISDVGESTCTISINAFHVVGVIYVSATSYHFYADGADCGGSTTATTFTHTAQLYLGNAVGVGDAFAGDYRWAVGYASAVTGPQAMSITALNP